MEDVQPLDLGDCGRQRLSLRCYCAHDLSPQLGRSPREDRGAGLVTLLEPPVRGKDQLGALSAVVTFVALVALNALGTVVTFLTGGAFLTLIALARCGA